MFRAATDDDLLPLTELERAANLAGLGHVFPPDRFPFPFDDVLARWRLALDDPAARVLVRDSSDDTGLLAYVAHDRDTLRHLAVRPDHWGEGLGSTAVAVAVQAMARGGCRTAHLWALEDNHRAGALYTRLGWSPSAEVREASWPPHPLERRWTRPILRSPDSSAPAHPFVVE